MRVLLYKDLNTRRVKAAFAKVVALIEADDFRSADIKKLAPTRYWRAKLDYSNRLLLQFARYGSETVCLALEVIENHAYEKSRFLRGATLDEAKIERESVLPDAAAACAQTDTEPLRWMHASRNEFELLDKPIMFDDAQEAVRRLPPPVVVVGSAGSGKTAVTLAKLRDPDGRVLYVTLSAYLAQSARSLYAAHGFENTAQEVDFLSYREFVETLRVPVGREVTFTAFAGWFERHRQSSRASLGEIDAHALFEEFRGVISASPQGQLDLPGYLALGPRQSLLGVQAREAAHALFQRYQQWLLETHLFDLNLVAHQWQSLARPIYDFVVIDEVQDLTNVQLALVLACLKKPGAFLLCGDSNQIVHPNFFSWAAVRSLFWHGLAGEAAQHQTLSVLQANFRNTRAVTELANNLLKIKQARFGSIDRESNFLVQSASSCDGQVRLLPAKAAALRELDVQTRASVHHAVVVLRDEDKGAAREHFRTPLVFSVHEAKGMEYPHVILYALVTHQRAAYAEVCNGVTPADLTVEELSYKRARDKGDKSLELYKFYVNALYVAMTRAVESLTLVEGDTEHPLLQLLGLKVDAQQNADTAAVQTSTREEWAQEARKLELQGKEEQARAIREAFLQSKPVPWAPWSEALIKELLPRALDRTQPSSKPRQTLLDYALWHGQQAWIEQLATKANFAPARTLVPGEEYGGLRPWDYDGDYLQQEQIGYRMVAALRHRHLQPYTAHNFKDFLRQCDTYGVDHRTPTGGTTLMLAARAGNLALVDALLKRSADPLVADEFGHTAWFAALSRALEDAEFARTKIGPLFERIAPAVLDVQTDERLVRLERHQGEYWVLSLMLAGLKTLRARCVERSHSPYKYEDGFFADALQITLEYLPEHLWVAKRRKRSYVNSVLARAEAQSQYTPARKLWIRTKNGHYLPNPKLMLRTAPGQDDARWMPVLEVLNLHWVDIGTKRPAAWAQSLVELFENKTYF
jgi:AAA domain